jgi:two-component system, sporulation sensor kinase C
MVSRKRKPPAEVGDGEFRKALRGAATGIAILTSSGTILYSNESFAKIVDRRPEEIPKLNLFDLIHPEDRSRHQALLKQLFANAIPHFVIEKRYIRPDGSSVWARNSVSLAGKRSAGRSHLACICEDINDRKQAEQAVRNQERLAALGRLASAIVHEIRNPLEAASNLIFLAQKASSIEEARHYLTTAEEEVGRASNIATQGLHFSRQSAAPLLTNLADLLESVLSMLKGRLNRAHVRVEFLHSGSTELVCFPGEMRQVFANIIVNAIDAMPGGGRLILKLRSATDWRTNRPGVRVTIADTGVGMSPDTRRKIYRAFFTTKGPEGSGVGLWVTANIVDKHDGSMHVRSRKGYGATGTAFTLIFPEGGVEGKPAGFVGPSSDQPG